MKKTILFFSILLASCAGKQTQEIRTMERLSTASHNDYYVSNRAPLQPLQFIKLPAGSIEPEGWIRRQPSGYYHLSPRSRKSNLLCLLQPAPF